MEKVQIHAQPLDGCITERRCFHFSVSSRRLFQIEVPNSQASLLVTSARSLGLNRISPPLTILRQTPKWNEWTTGLPNTSTCMLTTTRMTGPSGYPWPSLPWTTKWAPPQASPHSTSTMDVTHTCRTFGISGWRRKVQLSSGNSWDRWGRRQRRRWSGLYECQENHSTGVFALPSVSNPGTWSILRIQI